ncbi:MAG: DUF7487 domain-containing protein, partial [Nitrosopumilaceae archaeon]
MLIELLHQHNIITSSGKTNPGCNRLAKKYPYIFQQIINATIFCSEQATWGQRIFCIKNNITCLPRCKNCDKPTRYTIDCRYNEFCSSICANKCEIKNTKARQTCLKKYGVEYVLQTTLVKEKTKQTYLKKYGVEHNTQIFNYEENRKQTCLK